jgi:type I restriction enzyme S subunit
MKWRTVLLREVAPAEAASIRFTPDDVVWRLTLDQIESNTGNIIKKKVAPGSEAGTSSYAFDDGNVLYSKLRPYLNKVICPSAPGIATTELIPLRPRPEVLDRRFLTYYLRSKHFLTFANVAVAGVKMPRLIMAKFWKHKVPLPSMSEQRRIVEILDQADALRRKRAEADAKAARILPALFYKMFGDPATNPMGWPVEIVADVATVRRGDFRHRPRTEPRFYGGPYPFIQINDITASDIVIRGHSQTLNEEGLRISRMFPKGTVVLSIAATIATSGILGFDSCFPDSLVGVQGREGKATQEFLLFFFRLMAPKLSAIAPQLAQKNINLGIVNNLEIPVPPLETQVAFSQSVQVVVGTLECQNVLRKKQDSLWRVLLHRAFAGDLTAKWREAHRGELLAELEQQTKYLEGPHE